MFVALSLMLSATGAMPLHYETRELRFDVALPLLTAPAVSVER